MKDYQKSIITLTTDFGTEDHYVACMKGVILSINPGVTIVDNTHSINSYDIERAALNLLNMYSYYPAGTIHVAVVDPGVGRTRRPIAAYSGGYYFVGPDNGIFSFIFNKLEDVNIYNLKNRDYFLENISNTFHGRDIFAPVSSYLSLGKSIENFGRKLSGYTRLSISKPVIKGKKLIGKILYSDKFGNLITNISGEYCEKISGIRIDTKLITRISSSYRDVKKGEIVALIGSSGYLEISVNMGNAADLINSKSEIYCLLK